MIDVDFSGLPFCNNQREIPFREPMWFQVLLGIAPCPGAMPMNASDGACVFRIGCDAFCDFQTKTARRNDDAYAVQSEICEWIAYQNGTSYVNAF